MTQDIYVIGGSLPSGGTLNTNFNPGIGSFRFRVYAGDAYAMKFVDTDGASINDIYVHKRANQSFQAFKLPDDFARDSLPTRILQTPEALTSGQLNMLATYAFAVRTVGNTFTETGSTSITVSGLNRGGTIYYASYTHKAYSDIGVLASTQIRHIKNAGNDLDFSETEAITLLPNPLAVLSTTQVSTLDADNIDNLDKLASYITYKHYQDFISRTSTANVPNVQPVYASGSLLNLNGDGTIRSRGSSLETITATGFPREDEENPVTVTPTMLGGHSAQSITEGNITINVYDGITTQDYTFLASLVGNGEANAYEFIPAGSITGAYIWKEGDNFRIDDRRDDGTRVDYVTRFNSMTFQVRETSIGNSIVVDSTTDLDVTLKTATTTISKGSSFTGIGLGTNATLNLIDNIEVRFDVVNGTLEGLQTTGQGIAVNGAKIGTPNWSTALTLIAGSSYTFRDADLRDAIFPVNNGASITINTEGATRLPTLPNGYLIPLSLEVSVAFPDGYDETRAHIGVYGVDGETVTQLGAFNDTTFSSSDIDGLGSTIQNIRVVVTGEGLTSVIQNYTITSDLSVTISVESDRAFNAGATLGGLNGVNLPQRIDGTVINSFDDLISLENTTMNILKVKVVGFSGSALARASNAVTNKMIGTSKRLSTYNEHVAKTGGDTIILLNTSEIGLIQDKYELANGEGGAVTTVGTQEVTSMYEIQGGGVLSDILSIASDGQQQLVYVNPNPNGISPETLASILLSRGSEIIRQL